MGTDEPRSHPKTPLVLFTVMVVLVIVIGVPLGVFTDWSAWITGAVAGGAGGLMGPFITRWLMARVERTQDPPSEGTDR